MDIIISALFEVQMYDYFTKQHILIFMVNSTVYKNLFIVILNAISNLWNINLDFHFC